MLELIEREIAKDRYYTQNFPNDGQRFVAWYLRRVLLRSPEEARQEITDGANDKQIDAVIVDDENRKIVIVQGKFIKNALVDAEPLREVLSAWLRLQELDSLQKDANERLRERLEAVRGAINDEYELELLTTGTVHDLSVVNGCQSLTTIHSCSESVRKKDGEAFILFRFYEILQRDLADKISVYTNSQSAVKSRDLRSNDRTMLALKRAYESLYRDGFFITQRGAQRPADRDADKTIDCADFGKGVMAWHCQRPNISYNERRLFDEYYKQLFRADYDPSSMLALQTWINAIESAWENLQLNEALKAGKSYVKFHILYAVSSLIAHASGQGDKVPYPSATLAAGQRYSLEILPLAVNCVNRAMEQANTQAQLSNKVFSPQNWCKALSSVQGETLVASTIVGMMPGLGAGDLIAKLKVASEAFGFRWSAE